MSLRSRLMVATIAVVVAGTPWSRADAPKAHLVSCTGVQLAPGANIRRAVAARPPGTTFCLADGRYTTTATIEPKDGDRFIGVYADGTQPNIANTGTGDVFEAGRDVLIRGLGIGPSAGSGLNPGTGSTITGDHIHDNRGCGIDTAGNHLFITNNDIGPHNGTTKNRGGACGIKLHGYPGANSGAYSVVTGNVVHDNGFLWSSYAVEILDSIGGTVSGNAFTHNYRGVNIWADRRARLKIARSGLGCADIDLTGYHPKGITIKNNRFATPQRSGFATSGQVPVSAAGFDSNCWTVKGWSDTNWRLHTDATATWAQWRRAGEDPHGWEQTSPC